MESIEFKKWVQTQIQTDLAPIFRKEKLKKGRTNCYVREQNNMLQIIQFVIRQHNVKLIGGISPIFYPLTILPYYGFDLLSSEKHLCQSGIYVPLPITGVPAVTPAAMEKWEEMRRIIVDKILDQFNQVSDLDELMEIAQYDVPDRAPWNGVKWYVRGVHQCRFGDFSQGVEWLKKAQSYKSDYLALLEDGILDINRDQFALVFHYIDLLCDAVTDDPDNTKFLSVYEMICENTRKQYKL